MDWIKKNSEKFSLLLLSAALLGVSIFLIINAQAFLASFASLNQPVIQNNKQNALDTKSLEATQAALEKPVQWITHGADPGSSLFVSRQYILSPDGQTLSEIQDAVSHGRVPNKWLLDHHLDPLDPDILNEDADGDGFSNGDEFDGKTDPNDKNSHPPYTTKLVLEKFIQVPFRLVFKGQPDDDTFQINTLDVNQPSQILKMGDQIPLTRFKIVKFEKKGHKNDSDVDIDDSELTLQNIDTNAKVVLVFEIVGNSPDSFAKFKYLWGTPNEFTVKKDGVFSLKPETDVNYKLIDINDKEATIQNLKTNEEIKIHPQP